MQFVPWKYVSNWRCIACGDCCKLYSVVINLHEWLRIIKTYGVEQTTSGLDKLFIKRRPDGSCTFLDNSWGTYTCGIQHMKPRACQIWPFKISMRPEYGYPNEAEYTRMGKSLFVYVDPMCNGIKYGTPTYEFTNSTLKEFAEIYLGILARQYKTTGSISWPKPQLNLARFGQSR
jgi:Fe-S-cluster containining protein